METPDFALRVTENGHGPLVKIAGEIDLATAPRLRSCLRDFTGERVTLDLSAVTFLDSTGINVLIDAHKKAFQTGGSIILHGVQPMQMNVMEITGLTEYLNFDGNGHGDVPKELVDAARQELEYPADATNEG